MTRWALIDCENLTHPRHLGWAGRWRGFEHVELFGRAWAVARWRLALQRPCAETIIADDAPPQAADTAIQARLVEITENPPSRIVLASNDSDFLPDFERLSQAGFTIEWVRDLRSPSAAIRLAVAELGSGGRASAAAVGELLWVRYGIRTKGRLREFVRQAGGTVTGPLIILSD